MRFNDLHSSADGLIGKILGTPGTAGDYAAQGTHAVLGCVKDTFLGIGELAYEGGELAVSAQQNITNPATMYGQVLEAKILAENVRLGNVTTGTMANGAMSTATNVGKAIIAPVTQPLGTRPMRRTSHTRHNRSCHKLNSITILRQH